MTAGIEFGSDGMPIVDATGTDDKLSVIDGIIEDAFANATQQGEPGNAPAPEDPIVAKAAHEAFSAPAGPWEYDMTPIYGGTQPSDQDLQEQIGIQQSLHAEGVPAFAVSFAAQVMAAARKDGFPDPSSLQSSIASCRRELESRHGKAADVMFDDAHRLIDRLAARNPLIGDILEKTGAVANAGLLETLARVERAQRR